MVQRVSVLRRKTLGRVLLLTAALVAAVLLIGHFIHGRGERPIKADTNEQRIHYLSSLGWEVGGEPLSEQTIKLPQTFPEVLKKYNRLQQEQGFDLEKYAGKEITMYSYAVANPPCEGEGLCSVYVYKGRLIGGDVHSAASNGTMVGIR